MLSLHYFASIREACGRADESLELPDQVSDVRGLVNYLSGREPDLRAILADENRVLVAVNQTVVDRDHALHGDEEVAFFPPMTGG
jgi:molybdopterin synthase sulfur carrier subunit